MPDLPVMSMCPLSGPMGATRMIPTSHRTDGPQPARADRIRLGGLRPSRSAAFLLPLVVLLTLLAPVGAEAALPPGFADEKVVDVPLPTALAFTPDGRMLVTAKPGVLYVGANGNPGGTVEKALTITPKVCSNYERGLLGVAVDPEFASNGFVYLYYTFKKHGNCDRDTSKVPVNRVSRFVMTGSTIAPASEKVLLDNITSRHGNHNAGDLEFGKDGYLYVSIGDSGCDLNDTVASDLCGPDNANARRPELLLGKIARITRDGGIPRTNPSTGLRTGSCAANGRTKPGYQCQETFASGLRNPFRFAFDPNASGTRFLINDVGQYTWEEIDEGRKGADYGWNEREGFCANGTTNCSMAATVGRYTSPIHHYPHTSGCSSVTGGAFVPKGVWPAEYDGNYLFSDYVCGGLYRLLPDGNGGFQRPSAGRVGTPFVPQGEGSPVHLRFGPYGSSQTLYYTSFVGGGQVRRIVPTETTNQRPTSRASAEPTQGAAPLDVAFDGSVSSDPDDASLTHAWDFGDGSAAGSGPTPTHTYEQAGQYIATLTVTDADGAIDRATIDIDAGNQLPRAVIDAPAPGKRFSVEEQITLVGHAADANGAEIPGAELAWEVLLHHNTHAHPYEERTGNNVAFDAPFPEDLDAATTSYLEIRLTVAVDGRRSRTVSQNLEPNKVALTFASDPTELEVRVNGTAVTGTDAVTSWAGWNLRLEAPTQTDGRGQSFAFDGWSDGETRATRTLTTPGEDRTYTASFRPVTVFAPVADAQVLQGRPGTNFGRAGVLTVGGGRGEVAESYLRFVVGGLDGPVTNATLRLFVPTTRGAASANGPAVFRAGNRWGETTITWERRPPRTTGAADDKGAIAAGTWVEYDVTRLIGADGAYTFVLASAARDGTVFASGETATPPELVVTTGAGTAPTASQTETATETAPESATGSRDAPTRERDRTRQRQR